MSRTPSKNKTGRPAQPAGSPSRRRWFRIGPGLLLALVASYFVWRQMPPQSTLPRVERTPLNNAPSGLTTPGGLSAPEPAWLLAQREELKMSASQLQKLSRLRARWERDTRELRDELARASDDFNRSMAEEKGARLTMPQLQERAAPVSELSSQLSMARHAWWDEAARVLSSEQRQRAEKKWAQRFMSNPSDTEAQRGSENRE